MSFFLTICVISLPYNVLGSISYTSLNCICSYMDSMQSYKQMKHES